MVRLAWCASGCYLLHKHKLVTSYCYELYIIRQYTHVHPHYSYSLYTYIYNTPTHTHSIIQQSRAPIRAQVLVQDSAREIAQREARRDENKTIHTSVCVYEGQRSEGERRERNKNKGQLGHFAGSLALSSRVINRS